MELSAMMTYSDYLEHAGVKGMKWGQRKADLPIAVGSGWTIKSDGSVDIDKGTNIQRVVRGHAGLFGGVGEDFGGADSMYASFTPRDNAQYEHFFGRKKGLLVKEASRVLTFETNVSLKAPPPKESAKEYLQMLREDPKLLASVNKGLSGFAKINLARAMQNPETSSAMDIYSIAYDAGNYNPKMQGVNKAFHARLGKKGYNMVIDASDALAEFQAPVVIFNAKQNVALKSQKIVDQISQEVVRKEVQAQNQNSATQGRAIMEALGYTY